MANRIENPISALEARGQVAALRDAAEKYQNSASMLDGWGDSEFAIEQHNLASNELYKALTDTAATAQAHDAERIEALESALAEARGQRDRYLAVLKGAEYPLTPGFHELNLEDCFRIGATSALLTKAIRGQRDDARLQAAALWGALYRLHHVVCSATGFAAAVRNESGKAYPWESLDEADEVARTMLEKSEGLVGMVRDELEELSAQDLIRRLRTAHEVYCRAKGRDPAKYTSEFSLAANAAEQVWSKRNG